jgi:antitoxin component YwqK of YwqJK toxin-antitoxin module
MLKKITFYLVLITFLSSCFTSGTKKTAEKTDDNDSIIVVKKTFKTNPKKIEYEISILKGTNKRHGLQKRFYPHGSLYSEIDYLMNKRVGVAKTYYQAFGGKKPQVWKEQPYTNGKLDGTCRRYHKNGQLQAEYVYKMGLPGLGLKEFTNKGVPVKQPKLILSSKKKKGFIEITAKMSNKAKKVKYFAGFLVDGKYVSKNMKELEVKNGVGRLLIPITATKRFENITAVASTRFYNKLIVTGTIKY